MKLNEYLDKVGISVSEFSRRAGISVPTMFNILKDNRDLFLSVAVKIERQTKGEVTCSELLPESVIHKKRKKKGEFSKKD